MYDPRPSQEEVMRVAKAMCVAAGFDPEQRGYNVPHINGPLGSTILPHESCLVPLWAFYLDLAEAAIVAVQNINTKV